MWQCIACNVTHTDVSKEPRAFIFNALYTVTIYQFEGQNMTAGVIKSLWTPLPQTQISLDYALFFVYINFFCTHDKAICGVCVCVHAFSRWLSQPGRRTVSKNSWYQPNSKLCGRQNNSRRLGEGNNVLHLTEVEPIFVSIADCSLLNIPNTLPLFHLRC
jgi:hypothetical protein